MTRLGRPKLNTNPLEQVRAFIPVNDTARLNTIAEARGVTVNTLIREAVASFLVGKS